MRPYLEKTLHKKGLVKEKALSSSPSTTKKKKKKGKLASALEQE
jgi:hypothetical protein